MPLHNRQELNNNLTRRADEDLAFTAALGIDDVVQAVVKHRYADHSDLIFSGLLQVGKV